MRPKKIPAKTQTAAPRKSRGLLSKWKWRGLLLLVVFVAYANSFGLGAVVDGSLILQQDGRIRSVSAEHIRQIVEKDYWWPSSSDQLYRPVTTGSFLFNWAVLGNGNDPAGYHAVNFGLHMVNVWLVFELALLVFGEALPAVFAAALWGVHPVGVESVANIAGRADLLAVAGVLGALVLYIRTRGATGRGRVLGLAGIFALAMFAVFAKENGAVLIALMLLWDISLGRGKTRRLDAYAVAAVPLALLAWARWSIFRGLPLPPVNVVDNPLLGAGFWASRFTAIKIIGKELWLLACPIQLVSDRSYNQIPVSGMGDLAAWIALIAVAAILGVAIARYRKDPTTFWAVGFLGIALLPTSNLVVRIGAAMAERFLYLPAVGFAIAVAALAWRLQSRRTAMMVLGAAILLCAGRTMARNPVWNDELKLGSTDVQTSAASFRLHALLAQQLFVQDPRNSLDEAIREMEAAWKVLKPLPDAQNVETVPAVLGTFYGLKGEREGGLSTSQGRQWYEKSLDTLLIAKRISLAFQKSYDELQLANGRPLPKLIGFEALDSYLGQAYWRLGQKDVAIRWYREGRTRRPDNLVGYDTLAKAYFDEADWGNAAVVLYEKLTIGGATPATVAALRNVYTHIPEGACATGETSGVVQLNLGCPRLRSDACKAFADLMEINRKGRRPEALSSLQATAARDYGCPAQ